MNSQQLLKAIHATNTSISRNQQKWKQATHAIAQALTPPEPYVYMMPIVAFFVGMRYSDPLTKHVSVMSLYRYGLLLMPLLKE